MIDETTARVLQDRYISGMRGGLGGLYAELKVFATVAIKVYLKSHGNHHDDIDEMAHTVSARIIERYLKRDYYIRHFYELVRRECLHTLTEGARAEKTVKGKAERSSVPLESVEGITLALDHPEDRAFYIADIIASATYGMRGVIDIFYSRSWRGALRTIAKYATEQWMVNQMHRLRDVYRLTHGEERRHGLTGRRGVGGNKTAMRTLRTQTLLCGQRDAEDMVSGEG